MNAAASPSVSPVAGPAGMGILPRVVPGSRSVGAVVAAGLLALLALGLRWPDLDSRPIHMDEANNAFLVGEILRGQDFVYRVHDHHGPTLFLLAAASLRAQGVPSFAAMEAAPLRLIPLLAGAALAALLVAFAPTLGLTAALAAGAFVALAAPYVYYSGIFIHESLLVLLTAAWLLLFLRWRTTARLPLALGWGLVAGLMLATKETAAPILVILAAAFLPGRAPAPRQLLPGLAAGLLAAVAVVFTLYSDGFRHPDRALDLARAVAPQLARGFGSAHEYPWWQYLAWFAAPAAVGLPWSGGLLLAFAALGAWTHRHDDLPRRLTLAAALLAAFFFALPYKTPWLILPVALPLVLLAGLGVARLLATPRLPRAAAVGILSAAAALLLTETLQRTRGDAAVSPANPLAYAPTSLDLRRLESLLAAAPGTTVSVLARDYWPLPWTLRRHAAGFWTQPPATWPPGLLLVGPEQVGAVAEFAPFTPYEIRPGVLVFAARVP